MKVIAVSVGEPRDVEWRGHRERTSIHKTPTARRVRVSRTNLEGDEQSDLSVHGGPEKAVYAYPREHYAFWRDDLPDWELPWGAFGENLTTEGLRESDVRIGDRFRVGTSELVVTQPRMPCHKLAIRFDDPDIVRRFLDSRRSGFYLSVAREGELGAGDAIERIARDERPLTVENVVSLYAKSLRDPVLLDLAVGHPVLPDLWREVFRKRRDSLDR